MVQVDGGWLATDARKDRIDCALKGCAGEVQDWRPSKDAAAPHVDEGFKLQPSHAVISLIISALTAELAVIKSRSEGGCRAVANPFLSCH